MQHWLYASVYIDAGLVVRLYFGATSIESIETRERRERATSSFNGLIYALFLGVFLTDFFIDSDELQTIAYAILSGFMAVTLGWAFNRMTALLRMLKSRGLTIRKKTIIIQLAFLGLIAFLDTVYFNVKVRFWNDCTDDVMA